MTDDELIIDTSSNDLVVDVDTSNIDVNVDTNEPIEVDMSTNNELEAEISGGGEIELSLSSPNEVEVDLNNSTVATGSYNDLEHKPQINSVELIGNLSLKQLDIQKTMDYLTNTDIERLISD